MTTRTKPYSLLFLTTSLDVGGAQMMLVRLLTGLDRNRFSPTVISLVRPGPLQATIEGLGIPVYSLEMPRGIPHPGALVKLVTWLRRNRPDAIQTWMYHADLLGGIAAKFVGGIPVAWGIRHSNLNPHASGRMTICTMRMCAHMSKRVPTRIVCCSEASRQVHADLGYAAEKMVVIPNGLDLSLFKPDSAARQSVRLELQIPEQTPMIGLVGRFNPQKDHQTFVRAASLIHSIRPDVHFLLCGEGVTMENSPLRKWIEDGGITNRCHLLGRRDDMARLTAALDIASSSSSFGEGFPNVLGEAMSCGIPCVVTDVGDSALIVGDTGRVVPPHNPQALSTAILDFVALGSEGRYRLGTAARLRVREHFNLPDIVERYENFYLELVGRTTQS